MVLNRRVLILSMVLALANGGDMETAMKFYTWAMSPAGQSVLLMVVSVLLLISEYLGETEKFKASSIIGAIKNVLKSLKEKLSAPKPPTG